MRKLFNLLASVSFLIVFISPVVWTARVLFFDLNGWHKYGFIVCEIASCTHELVHADNFITDASSDPLFKRVVDQGYIIKIDRSYKELHAKYYQLNEPYHIAPGLEKFYNIERIREWEKEINRSKTICFGYFSIDLGLAVCI